MSRYRRKGDRDPLELVGEATRLSIVRALAAAPTKADLRVELAIVHELSAWTRTRNAIRFDRILDIVGGDERHVRRALRALHDAGAIVYRPGLGKRLSTIALPGHALDRPLLIEVPEGASFALSEEASFALSEGASFAPSNELDRREGLTLEGLRLETVQGRCVDCEREDVELVNALVGLCADCAAANRENVRRSA